MNVPVPVKGSITWTSRSVSDCPNSFLRTSSTELTMKSTHSTGV